MSILLPNPITIPQEFPKYGTPLYGVLSPVVFGYSHAAAPNFLLSKFLQKKGCLPVLVKPKPLTFCSWKWARLVILDQ
jgi:hypothetical protein